MFLGTSDLEDLQLRFPGFKGNAPKGLGIDLALYQKAFIHLPFSSLSPPDSIGNSIWRD
jgi:hypothetical protein